MSGSGAGSSGGSAAVPPDSSGNSGTPVSTAGGQSDEQAAQSYYDDEIGGIHDRMDGIEETIGELQESIIHLSRSMKIGRGTNQQTGQTPSGPAQRQQEQATSDGGAGQSLGTAPAAREPERNPAPGHWWFRPLFGR